MTIKWNYFLIPLVTVLVAIFGGIFTQSGMEWYDTTLIRPALNPPKWVFPIAWNFIFITATISALIVFNAGRRPWKILWFKLGERVDPYYWTLLILFAANAFLNVFWSYLFFNQHNISAAFIEMMGLEVTVALLMIFSWHISKWASLLLLPYLLWVGFATYLTYMIMIIN